MGNKEKVHFPLRVKVKLKETCFVSDNKWKCTIDGEERILTDQYITWFKQNIKDVESALNSINMDEILFFTIEGKPNQNK